MTRALSPSVSSPCIAAPVSLFLSTMDRIYNEYETQLNRQSLFRQHLCCWLPELSPSEEDLLAIWCKSSVWLAVWNRFVFLRPRSCLSCSFSACNSWFSDSSPINLSSSSAISRWSSPRCAPSSSFAKREPLVLVRVLRRL